MKRKAGRGAEVKDVSRSARIALALHRLGGDHPAVIEKHAGLIFVAMIDHVIAERARGHDIGQDSSGFYYANPRLTTVGPARELRDLRLICRKAIAGKISPEQWTTAWAAMPQRITRLCRPPLIETRLPERRGAWILAPGASGIRRDIDSSTLALGFAAASFVMVAPKPLIVLPIIERELARITETPKPKTRKHDVEATAARAAIHNAFREIAGPGRRGKLALGRRIDRIFGTALFAAKV
jgi:hypothetical protein